MRRAHQAGGGGERVALLLRVAAARLDDVAHARPFLEPGLVVADLVLERAADAVDLVDLGAAPRRGGQAQQQAHRPAVVGREIDEGRIVLFGRSRFLRFAVVVAAERVAVPLPCGRAASVFSTFGGYGVSLTLTMPDDHERPSRKRPWLRREPVLPSTVSKASPCSTSPNAGPRLDLQQHLADLEARGPARPHRPADQQGHRAASAGALAVHRRRAGGRAPRVPVHQRDRRQGPPLRHAGGGRRARGLAGDLRASAWAGRSRRSATPGCAAIANPIPPVRDQRRAVPGGRDHRRRRCARERR